MNRGAIKIIGTSGDNEWTTPNALFKELDDQYHFNLDPCCTHETALCDKHYTPEDDGLKQDWGGYTVFMNPPYGRNVGAWMEKAYKESKKPNTTVVALVFSKTSTRWFHDWVYHKADIKFIKGRLHFRESGYNAPYDSMLCIYGKGHDGKLI